MGWARGPAGRNDYLRSTCLPKACEWRLLVLVVSESISVTVVDRYGGRWVRGRKVDRRKPVV